MGYIYSKGIAVEAEWFTVLRFPNENGGMSTIAQVCHKRAKRSHQDLPLRFAASPSHFTEEGMNLCVMPH